MDYYPCSVHVVYKVIYVIGYRRFPTMQMQKDKTGGYFYSQKLVFFLVPYPKLLVQAPQSSFRF